MKGCFDFMSINIPNVDFKLEKLSRMFKENAEDYVKLSVLNEVIINEICKLLEQKFSCIERVRYDDDWFYVICEWGNQLTTKDVLTIEELCDCNLISFQEVNYKFRFNIDGNYRHLFRPGKNKVDYDEYHEILSIVYGDVMNSE